MKPLFSVSLSDPITPTYDRHCKQENFVANVSNARPTMTVATTENATQIPELACASVPILLIEKA